MPDDDFGEKRGKLPIVEEIRIIVFNIMGIRLGMDVEFIAEMCEPEVAKARKIKTFRFHEKIRFRMKQIEYETPKVLLIKDGNGVSGIVIDRPEEINVPVRTDNIRPLPPLIEAFDGTAPIWGVTVTDSGIVLLVDPYKLQNS